jgi:hypothetical protein
MAVKFVPLAEEHLDAVRAFNKRMLEGDAPTEFLLPEETSRHRPAPNAPIQWKEFVAVDGTDIRGGVLEMDLPGWLNGREIRASNFQSPLSEGIIDRRFASVGAQLVKFMQSRNEAVYAIGMGAADSSWRRLLKASGWSLKPIPFLFRVHRPRAFFRELPMLHSTRARSAAARVAGVTGLGSFALAIKQRPRVRAALSVRQINGWGDWADEIWQHFRGVCSFAVQRDRRTLEALYPQDDARLQTLLFEQGGDPLAWAVCVDTQMKDHRFFGSLRVASILDCASPPALMAATAAAVDHEMGSRGADIVLLNHSHSAWVRAFQSAGFLSGPSNYMLGMSKRLTEAVQTSAGGEESVHITRGDGDGRNNLM